jgi:hypothetical protein
LTGAEKEIEPDAKVPPRKKRPEGKNKKTIATSRKNLGFRVNLLLGRTEKESKTESLIQISNLR